MKCNEHLDSRSSKYLESFRHLQTALMHYVHKTALKNDLSVPQFTVVMTIAPHLEMTQKQLGEIVRFPKSTLSQAIDGLVQADILSREPVENNRREMNLRLIEKGQQLVEEMRKQKGSLDQTIDKAIETLSDEQFENIITIHKQITEILDKKASRQGDSC